MVVVDLLRKMIENVRESDDEGDVDVDAVVAAMEQDLAAPATPSSASPPPVVAAVAAALPVAAVIARPAGPDAPAPVEPASAASPQSPPDVGDSAPREAAGDSTVRVNVAVLDRLMNLIGELVLARNQMVQIAKSFRDSNVGAQAAGQRLSLVTSDLQEQIMKTRMQPVARVFEKIPRMVRDLCKETQKQVTSHIDGNTTEIDKALVEAIRDPVMHIVRNAIDHGIESPQQRLAAGKPAAGKLSVRAAHEGGMVTIEVEDDGKGMDPQGLRAHAVKKGLLTAAAADELSDRAALDLVFLPGFSTAAKVTDISGRGVGMDVVRTHVERAGGKVELDSTPGKGTIIRLKMPLTLAIIPALLVRSGGQRFAIPQVSLLELVYLNEDQAKTMIEHVRGAPIYRLRGEILPLVHLNTVLNLSPRVGAADVNIVVVAVGERRYGLVVDEIHDTEEIVIKPLHGQLKRLACYSGATVLGDGGVALILEVAGVAGMAGIDMSTRRGAAVVQVQEHRGGGPQPFIIFVAGDGVQCAVPLAMVARLEQIPANTIERVAGAEVVQYRKAIMPIVRPEAVIQLGARATGLSEQPLVVFDFGHMVGMAVNAIVDVVDVELDSAQAEGKGKFTLGRTVVLGKTTLLLDVYSIVRELAPQFVQERRKGVRRPKVLLVDDSSAMRSALGGFLRSSGMDVIDVASGELALAEMKAQPGKRFDAVITDLEMGGMDGFAVIRAVEKEDAKMPVFVWTYHDDSELEEKVRAAGARACINKLKREELIRVMQVEGIILDRRSSDRSAA